MKKVYGLLLVIAVVAAVVISGAFKGGQVTNNEKSLNVVLSNQDYATLGNVEMESPVIKGNKLTNIKATFNAPGDEAVIYFDIVNKGDDVIINKLTIDDPLFSAEGDNMEYEATKLASNFTYQLVYDGNGYQVQGGNLIERGTYKRVKLILKYNEEVSEPIYSKVTVSGLNIEFSYENV